MFTLAVVDRASIRLGVKLILLWILFFSLLFFFSTPLLASLVLYGVLAVVSWYLVFNWQKGWRSVEFRTNFARRVTFPQSDGELRLVGIWNIALMIFFWLPVTFFLFALRERVATPLDIFRFIIGALFSHLIFLDAVNQIIFRFCLEVNNESEY